MEIGTGFCRAADGSNPWEVHSSCINTVLECKNLCISRENCVGISFATEPQTNDSQGCKEDGLPRCNVYYGTTTQASSTLVESTSSSYQEYTSWALLPGKIY